MIDFAKNEDEEKRFIVDIETMPETMSITYADGTVRNEFYSLHNLNVYRLRMEEQASDNMDYAYDTLAKDSFKVYVKKFLAILGGIISGIVIYNVDIHVIMKIILALLLLFGEALYYLYNEIYLNVLAEDLSEIAATDYYLQNLDIFKYYDQEIGETGYVVPIEDIDRHSLTKEQLKEIKDMVVTLKNDGVKSKDISLTYGNPHK